jgi:hypothetical protein
MAERQNSGGIFRPGLIGRYAERRNRGVMVRAGLERTIWKAEAWEHLAHSGRVVVLVFDRAVSGPVPTKVRDLPTHDHLHQIK